MQTYRQFVMFVVLCCNYCLRYGGGAGRSNSDRVHSAGRGDGVGGAGITLNTHFCRLWYGAAGSGAGPFVDSQFEFDLNCEGWGRRR